MGQKVVIEILAGPDVGETFEFDKDQILVGRGSQCQMQVASPHVSRQQCELSRQGDQLVLENLGSVNVTYLNDRPIDRVYVQDGDLITFCDVALRVRLPRAGGEATADPDRTVAYKPGQPPPGAGQQAPPEPPGYQPPPPQAYAPPPPAHQPPPPAPAYAPPPVAAAPPGPPPMRGPPSMPSMGVGMGTGLHSSLASAPPVARPPALGPGQRLPGPPGPPPGMPGMPPGPPPMPGMTGAPPGMPSMPPPMQGRPGGPGLVSTRQRKRRKGGGTDGVNIQLIRNVVVGLAVVMLLLTITSKIIESTEAPPTKGVNQPAVAEVPMSEQLPTMVRADRTDQEIMRDAEGNFRTGETYLRQHRIADENLSIAIGSFKKSKAELSLVDPGSWPEWTVDLDPKHAEAEALLSEKFMDTKWNYVRFYQSADYDRAEAELERITRLVPDKNDDRNSYARERLRKVRDLMGGGGGKKHRWSDRK